MERGVKSGGMFVGRGGACISALLLFARLWEADLEASRLCCFFACVLGK